MTAFEAETLARAAKPRCLLDSDQSDGTLPSSLLHLDNPRLILSTSGTTGKPKGTVLTHRSPRARITTVRRVSGLPRNRRPRCLRPAHFGRGLICNRLSPWIYGADLYPVPRLRANIVSGLGNLPDKHQITFMSSALSVRRLVLKVATPPAASTLELGLWPGRLQIHCQGRNRSRIFRRFHENQFNLPGRGTRLRTLLRSSKREKKCLIPRTSNLARKLANGEIAL